MFGEEEKKSICDFPIAFDTLFLLGDQRIICSPASGNPIFLYLFDSSLSALWMHSLCRLPSALAVIADNDQANSGSATGAHSTVWSSC